MRRYRAMTLVETLMAILITLILGGALMAFLRSGLSLERAIAVNVSNQQSLRFPFWRLPPLVERANGLEILTVLPEAGTLSSSEIVAYVAASNDSQNLSATENNMYLRTNSGDTLIPGFSHISGALFERVPLFSGALPDSKDQAVRLTLTAENSGVELVYSADMRSLNRIPVAGPDSGPFLKIDLYGFPVLSPFIQYADVVAGVVSAEPIPKGTATLVVGTNVAGYFQILSGNPFSTIEYEWRLYSDILDVGTDRHEVIGKPGGSYYTSLQEHYDDRFTSADVGVSPPTGTSAHTDPPYVLNLKDSMVNKHITFAVREVGSAHWFESRSYLITRKPAQSGEFWNDLIRQLGKDIQDVKDGKDMKDRGYEILNPLEENASMSFQEEDGQTALTLEGTGHGNTMSFFSKLLEEKYFGYQTNGERDPGFCLENYTIWVDAEVSPPVTSGWGATINGNRKSNQYYYEDKDDGGKRKLKKEHLMYGYMLQFDPGLWAETNGEVTEYFDTHKTIGSIPHDVRTQGFTIRELTGYGEGYAKSGTGSEPPYYRKWYWDGEWKVGYANNNPGKGLNAMRRWRKSTPPGVDPLDPDYSREFLGRLDAYDILVDKDDWDGSEPSALSSVDYRRYFWRDVAYKEEGFLPSDEFGGEYSNRFAVSGDVLMSMRNVRYTTEINVITQTTVRPGSNPIVTEPDRIFFRVRVYDKPRVYDSVEKKWSFPRGTGRSKAMWFGLERGKNADWVLPANSDKDSLGDAHLFEAGDVSHELASLENKKIKTSKWHTNYAVGKHFGMRVWNWTRENGSAFKAKIYFVDIAKGLPLDFELPWKSTVRKSTVGDIIKPIAEGGTWNPKEPYELKQY